MTPSHFLTLTVVGVAISNPLPKGKTLAFAKIVTVPVDKFCLLVVTITVALALH
jgi:hypothetical protein